MLPTIAFCTTCKGRAEHVQRTLPENLRDNARYGHAKFILLNYNSRDHLETYVQDEHRESIESGRLSIYRFTEPTPFRMAHAKNLAHRLGMLEGANVLVNLDADNFTGPGFAEYVGEKFETPDVFLWSRMLKGEMPRGINGRIAVTAEEFLNAGGYDERFHTWSPDDKDFNIRLRRLGYRAEEIDPKFLNAIAHNDKMRFREYPEAESTMGEESFDEVEGSRGPTVANFGQVGLGVVYRNFDPEPIELRAIPTRIFGIGLHKTATTSLHQALKILGYKSGHWEDAHWARAIWEEMQTSGRSRTLEKYYAVCDLPIPLLFRELDQAYPGSKFILTTRSEEEWVNSVRNHWNPSKNRFRYQWDLDPFSHRVHRELYGQQWFDEQIFLGRYRRHNAEVLEYFKSRPQDLLVMDMSADAGWYELCGFLRQPIPSTPYPLLMASGQW